MNQTNAPHDFTPEEKANILQEHLLNHVPIDQLCARYQITEGQYYTWQKIFFEAGEAALKNDEVCQEKNNQIKELKRELHKRKVLICKLSESLSIIANQDTGYETLSPSSGTEILNLMA